MNPSAIPIFLLLLLPAKLDASELGGGANYDQTTSGSASAQPYGGFEVQYKSKDGTVDLTGTLTIPRGASQVPAVYLIPGASPFDRDQSMLGHRPFEVWADHLGRSGFAVLRMDDRGVGGSTGQKMASTLSVLADDVSQGVEFLASHPRVDPHWIGLIGHSLGATIAPLVASHNPQIAFIVLLAGPGTSFLEIQAHSKAGEGVGLEPINLDVARRVLSILQDDPSSDWESVDGTTRAYISELNDESTRQSAREFLEAMGPVASRFLQAPLFRDYFAYDPGPVLAQVKCPVLALGGDKDVEISRTLPAVAAALEGDDAPPYTISKLAGINHLLQIGENDEEQWKRSDHAVAPAVLQTVTRWIGGHASAQVADKHR